MAEERNVGDESGVFAGIRDVPIAQDTDDTLGLAPYARALGEFIRSCDTPITIGIQGAWGSGKTSLMNLMQSHLSDQVLCLRLNVWQYSQLSHGQDLPVWILQALYHKLAPREDTRREAVAQVMAFLRSVRLQKAEAAVTLAFEDDEGQSIFLDDLRNQFESLIAEKLQINYTDRLVVFLDDLDRVLPERGVEVLEILENFLVVPGVIVVIACDSEAEAFDRHVHVPFRMPMPRYDVRQYITRMLGCIQWRHTDEDLAVYEALLGLSVGHNPRSIKRLCNTCLLLSKVAAESGPAVADDASRRQVLFGLVCLATLSETAHSVLYDAADEQLAELASNPTAALDAIPGLDALATDEIDRLRLGGLLSFLAELVAGTGSDQREQVNALRDMLTLSSLISG